MNGNDGKPKIVQGELIQPQSDDKFITVIARGVNIMLAGTIMDNNSQLIPAAALQLLAAGVAAVAQAVKVDESRIVKPDIKIVMPDKP